MLDFVIEDILTVVKQAGDLVLTYYDKGEYLINKKNDNSPVTDADLASHDFLVKKLAVYGYPIFGEEGQYFQKNEGDVQYMWIIDPLDGTKDFIQRTGEFSVMVGLVNDRGYAVFGAVYAPFFDQMYYAYDGKGAFLRKKNMLSQISVNKKKIRGGRILVSRNHLGEREQNVAHLNNMTEMAMGSAGLKMCRIAQGDAELYINSSDKSSIWDICAGDVILRESGGIITDLDDKKIIYDHKNPILKNGYIAKNRAHKIRGIK